MDEKDWLILKTLFEKKSITKTAATLFISQPALSSRFAADRGPVRNNNCGEEGKKGLQFTPEGEYLVKRLM